LSYPLSEEITLLVVVNVVAVIKAATDVARLLSSVCERYVGVTTQNPVTNCSPPVR